MFVAACEDRFIVQNNGEIVTSARFIAQLEAAIEIAGGWREMGQGSWLWVDVQNCSPGVLRFMRVWVKDGAAWKLAAEQRTPIADGPAEGNNGQNDMPAGISPVSSQCTSDAGIRPTALNSSMKRLRLKASPS